MTTSHVANSGQTCISKQLCSTVIFALLLVTSVVLMSIWLFCSSTDLTLQYKLNVFVKDKFKVTLEVSSDVAENVVQHHLIDKDGADWCIVEDINRYLRTIKVQDQYGHSKCLLSPLEESHIIRPVNVAIPATQDVRTSDTIGYIEMMSVGREQVIDKSVLGGRARHLCTDIPVYWAHKLCFNDTILLADSSPLSVTSEKLCTPCGCGYKACVTCGTVHSHYTFDVAHWHWQCSWSVQTCTGNSPFLIPCTD